MGLIDNQGLDFVRFWAETQFSTPYPFSGQKFGSTGSLLQRSAQGVLTGRLKFTPMLMTLTFVPTPQAHGKSDPEPYWVNQSHVAV